MKKTPLPDSIKAEISCPVGLQIMLHPVTLIPSMKTVERDVAIRIFNEAKQKGKPPICPVSKRGHAVPGTKAVNIGLAVRVSYCF